MKASLHNLGCKVNSYETEVIQQMLEKEGYEIVDFDQPADVCIINTCSVTNIADRKSRQMIHKARKLNPDAIIVATGCYAQMFTQDIVDEASADLVIGNNNKKEIVRLIEEYRQKPDQSIICVDDLSRSCEYENTQSETTYDHTRAFVKIQDGCNQFCTYCIIPYSRGRIRSRAREDVIEEIRKLAANGFKEVVLTGIHLSSYGKGLEYGLIDIIEEVSEVAGIERIRLGSLEPGIITKEFMDRLVKVDKVCPHFHLSLQSGCDSVLSRMNRRYTSAEYLDKCKLIRSYYQHPAITTDIITGFPGETDEEFQTTLDFAKECDIYEIHIFKYSRRKGTKADKMPGQLPDKVKAARSSSLQVIANENTRRFADYYIGRQVEILVEEKINLDGRDYYIGHSKEYVKIAFRADNVDDNMENCLVEVTVKEMLKSDTLLGIFKDC